MSTNLSIYFWIVITFNFWANCADLPSYSGNYDVGIADIEVKVSQPRNISNEMLKDKNQPAFELDTVLFTLYYPIQKGTTSSKPQHFWLPRPVELIAQGIAASSGGSISSEIILIGFQAIAGNLVIPAAVDTPLIANKQRFPVLIFSHGDVSLSTWYSQYCGQLASRGYITAAIQHRDGSAAATVVIEKNGNSTTSHNVTYFSADQLSPSINSSDFTTKQRSFRQAEVEETIKVLQQINNGSGSDIYQSNSRNEGQDLVNWKDRLDFNHFVIGGHSFGATLALQVLEGAPSSTNPITASIVFDPGKESGPLNSNINVPLLISDSMEWSSIPSDFYGRKHFDVVKSIAKSDLQRTNGSWFTTLMGTAHVSISDAPVIAGSLINLFTNATANLTIDPKVALQSYIDQSTEFLVYLQNSSRTGVLSYGPTHSEFGIKLNSSPKVDPNIAKSWEIYVAPPSIASTSGSGRIINSAFVEWWKCLLIAIVITTIV